MSSTWHNRIVGHEEVAPDQLLAHPLNFRLHPKHQQDALRGVIADIGYIRSVLVNRTTGRVIDGHLRVTLALRDNVPLIPVEYVELTEPEEAEALATFDALTGLATLDAGNLDALLREVTTGDANVQQLLDDLATAAGLVPGVDEQAPGLGGDEFNTTPADGPTRTAVGDLWQLGRHRLLVGDCTIKEQVDRLMDGAEIDAVFTSPPYDQQRTYNGNMASDWLVLMQGAFAALLPHTAEAAQLFVNLGLVHRDGRVIRYWDPFIAWMEVEQDWPLFGWYVWDKLNGMPGDWNGRLAPAHEWVFHFAVEHVRPGKTIKSKTAGEIRTHTQRNPDGTLKPFTHVRAPIQPFKIHDSVIRHSPEHNGETGHPAPFPIGLPSVFYEAYPASAWYEPFCGSGTSIIAAERTGRTCYGCEIEPRYADVILRRWEAETGLVAVKVDDNNQLVGS